MTNKRTRNWTFILYPESASEDWRKILDSMYVEWVESPLHDKDETEEGKLKKPHIHVLLLFDTVKSYPQVLEITEEVKGTVPQKCRDVKSLVRYMIHIDDPEKYQYPKEEIKVHGDIDLDRFFVTAVSKKCEKIKEIIEFIREAGIIEFEDVLTYAMEHRYNDWFPLLCSSNATPIHMLLRSRRYRAHMD